MGEESIQMSKLVYNIGIEGQPSNNLNETDGFYNALAMSTGDIEQVNTRTEFVSTKHIKFSDDPILEKWVKRANSDPAPTTYTGAWQTVTHGNAGSTELLNINKVIEQGEVLRVHFNVMAGPDCQGLSNQDYWWMKIEIQDGVGNWTTLGYTTRNSKGHHRQIGSVNDPIDGWRRYGISFIKIFENQYSWDGIRVRIATESNNVNLCDWMIDAKVLGA